MTIPLFETTGATFSPCKQYRYRLWRVWDHDKPRLLFCMLNPSTADEAVNDPTVERCERRARAMGYGGLEVVNIFAYRATDPRVMKAQDDPVGPDNDTYLVMAAQQAGMIVCGWGTHGGHLNRGLLVARMLHQRGFKLHCLTITKGGQPGHPLYIGYDVQPKEMTK